MSEFAGSRGDFIRRGAAMATLTAGIGLNVMSLASTDDSNPNQRTVSYDFVQTDGRTDTPHQIDLLSSDVGNPYQANSIVLAGNVVPEAAPDPLGDLTDDLTDSENQTYWTRLMRDDDTIPVKMQWDGTVVVALALIMGGLAGDTLGRRTTSQGLEKSTLVTNVAAILALGYFSGEYFRNANLSPGYSLLPLGALALIIAYKNSPNSTRRKKDH